MSTVPMRVQDLMAPPVVKTIQQRSLLIGLVFSVIAALGAWRLPDNSSAPTCWASWHGWA